VVSAAVPVRVYGLHLHAPALNMQAQYGLRFSTASKRGTGADLGHRLKMALAGCGLSAET
jgi:hypothetical protein